MTVRRSICAVALVLAGSVMTSGGAWAQAVGTSPPDSAPAAPRPEDLRALADLLAKPEIQAWLRNPTLPNPAATQPDGPSLQEAVSDQVDAARSQLRELVETAPEMPQELAQARRTLMNDLRQRPIPAILLPVLFFAALGSLCEWLYWRTTGGVRRRINVRWAVMTDARVSIVSFR